MIRFCAISDIHGQFDGLTIKECDCLLICGDIVPSEVQHNMTDSKKFMKNVFIPWCLQQPCDQVFFIGGNHDIFLEKKSEEMKKLLTKQDKDHKIVYIEYNEEFGGDIMTYKGINIYGTPLCSIFGNWGFMRKHEEQTDMFCNAIKQYKDIKVHIVMSHDAPYGVTDVLDKSNPWGNTQNCGNTALKNFVRIINPDIMIHGHLHSSSHKWEKFGNTLVTNVSLLDDYYKKIYQPTYFELEEV